MEIAIRLEQLESRPLATVRRRATLTELKQVIPPAFGQVWEAIRVSKTTGVGRNVALYWDQVMNFEVGVETETVFPGEGEVVASATPAGTVVTTTHFGPYQQLPEIHRALREDCRERGHKLAGPFWEIYGHWQEEWNANPALIRTDIYYLIEPGESSEV